MMSIFESTIVDRPRHRHGKFVVSSLLVVALVVLGIAGARAILAPEAIPQTSSGDVSATLSLEAPASDTPHLDEAIEFIESEADWLYGNDGRDLPREFWFAVATMNYAQSRMRPARHNRIRRTGGNRPRSVEECLEQGAGICGHHVEFFIECMKRFGIRARTVEFYNRRKSDNHVVAEVLYDEQWRLIDVTWGTVYRKPDAGAAQLLSAEQLLRLEHPRDLAVDNNSDLWFQFVVHSQLDPLRYLSWQAKDVITDGVGIVHLFPVEGPSESVVRYVPIDRPSYFGSNRARDADNPGSLHCFLEYSGPDITAMTLDVAGVVGHGVVYVQSGQDRVSVPLDELHVGSNDIDLSELEVSEDILLSIEATSEDGIAYLVYRTIELQPNVR